MLGCDLSGFRLHYFLNLLAIFLCYSKSAHASVDKVIPVWGEDGRQVPAEPREESEFHEQKNHEAR